MTAQSPHRIPALDAVDQEAFKQAFRRYSAGVSVITGLHDDGSPAGFTATSLASLAAVPPLASFNMARSSSSFDAVDEGDWVAIHILGDGNQALGRLMAGPSLQRFAGDHWAPGAQGLPLLKDVPALMIGRVVHQIPVAENAVIVVEIAQGGLGEECGPLLYHERQFFGLGDPRD